MLLLSDGGVDAQQLTPFSYGLYIVEEYGVSSSCPYINVSPAKCRNIQIILVSLVNSAGFF